MDLLGVPYPKVVLVESHADDIFTSIGGILLDQKDYMAGVTLVTLTGAGPVNSESSEKLLDYFPNMQHRCLGYTDARLKRDEIRKVKEALGESPPPNSWFQYYNPDTSLPRVAQQLWDIQADAFVFPLGLHHPCHNIAYWISQCLPSDHVFYYADFPYCNMKSIQPVLQARTEHLVVKTYPVEDMAMKKKVFGAVYPSQWFIGVQLKDHPIERIYRHA